MRFLRGKSFLAVCVLAVLVGIEIGGSGVMGWIVGPDWFSRSIVRAWRTATDPPGPVRLAPRELAERDARLKAVFGDAVPKTFAFWEVDRLSGLAVKDLGGCVGNRAYLDQGALLPNKGCDLVKLRADFRVMLAESDPKAETVFLSRLLQFAPMFFFLGKDSKGKILLWADRRFASVRVSAPGLGSALERTGGYDNLMFGDDPGPDDDKGEPTLLFTGVHPDGRKEYFTMKVDRDLAQRFR